LRHHIFYSTNGIFRDGSNLVVSFSLVGPTVPELDHENLVPKPAMLRHVPLCTVPASPAWCMGSEPHLLATSYSLSKPTITVHIRSMFNPTTSRVHGSSQGGEPQVQKKIRLQSSSNILIAYIYFQKGNSVDIELVSRLMFQVSKQWSCKQGNQITQNFRDDDERVDLK